MTNTAIFITARSIALLCCFIVVSNNSRSQQPAASAEPVRVDSLFSRVEKDKPGYIVGVIKDGELVYGKGFGMANLEYKIPMTPASLFYMGSTSKHFTAACMLKLMDEGKCKRSDDIRTWLPEMPVYAKPITIDQLLHHTSGLREYTSLMLVSGGNRRFEDFYDNACIVQLLARQQHLNFPNTTAHQYSNGGYVLLAAIIERITKISLRKYADSVLFKPLGMAHSFFNDDHDEVIPDRVQSYRPTGNSYEGFVKGFDTYGDGGLFTTLEDLAKWDAAFYSDKLGIQNFASKMEQTGQLDNGHPINYAMGLYVSKYKGLKTVEHGGFMMAYDSEVLRFPEQHCTVIVLSNSYNTGSTQLAYQIADIYLEKNIEAAARPAAMGTASMDNHSIPSNFKTNADWSRYTGNYWSVNENFYLQVKLSHDSLLYDNTNGYTEWLVPLGKDSFRFANSELKMIFKGKDMQLVDASANTPVRPFRRFEPVQPNLSEVSRYTGAYYSEELQTTYAFTLVNGKLLLTINRTPPVQLFPAHDNVLWNSKNMVWNGFAEIIFNVNPSGKLTGITTGDNRLRGVDFLKIK